MHDYKTKQQICKIVELCLEDAHGMLQHSKQCTACSAACDWILLNGEVVAWDFLIIRLTGQHSRLSRSMGGVAVSR